VVPAAGRDQKQKGSTWAAIRAIQEGDATTRDAKLIYDVGDKQWYCILTVIRKRQPLPGLSPDIVVAVNRGRENFVFFTSNTGDRGHALRGDWLLEGKRRIRARLLQLKRTRGERGQGSRGHGSARRYAAEHRLREHESNLVDTACKQTAAAVVKYCQRVGAGTVVLEDFNSVPEDLRYIDRWPWAQLKQSILWACDKAGIKVREVPSEYISSQCPRCGNVDASQSTKTGVFHCAVCEYSRPVDYVATINMLTRSGADMTVWSKKDNQMKELERATAPT
jgi:IS605 OrfB family transposase